ncbi:TatD family hydrolase [Mesomycoplasma molare]|uniref:YchF/TatD family DNA exonuclease n=1 Tax=Mesomycoplasma molare TaxID=171288 RepID=A0ABY5TWP9_9BACT|nr:TatD family hydrolase [Mesomycoplasma molare]UWD34411.1 YchF/TatD family DNA exonuclease [Mesomycoplasma molare]
MANFKFVELSEKWKQVFINTDFENYFNFANIKDTKSEFDKVIQFLKSLRTFDNPMNLMGKFYFLIDLDKDFDEIAAFFNVRISEKNNNIIDSFGNIGYWTNPKCRNKGLATLCLEKALLVLKNEFDQDEILITHSKSNIASYKVIQKFHPIFLKKIDNDKETLMYSIKTNDVKEKKLIDLHTHPFLEYYDNPDQEIQENFQNGIEKMFFVSTSWKENKEIINIYKKYKNLFPVLGIHPNNVRENDNFALLEKEINQDVVAIGEVGLDYYYENNPPREIQINALISQIKIAKKFNLPVILHIREAFEDIYKILNKKEYQNINFIFHTYSGNVEWTKKFLKLSNLYFSFSGVITFKKNIESRKVIEMIPLERIFTETDAPYLTPEPFRSKTNHSYFVLYVLETISLIKGISKEKMKEQIIKNVERVFKV